MIYYTYYETETYKEPVYRYEEVYQTKYYYEIDKWIYDRTEISSGYDKKTYWPETILAADEKIASKSEKYYVTGKDKEVCYLMTYEEWMSIEVNQTLTLKVTSFGNASLEE